MGEHAFVFARPPDPWSYPYLLGAYLGDGRLDDNRLVLTVDAAHPEVVDECWAAMQLTAPSSPARRQATASGRAVRVESCSRDWPTLLPRRDPHLRVKDWQQQIVDRHPGRFLRGLIHSDGCRTINRFTTRLPSGRVREYAYPRYFFSNESPDVRAMFCRTCERLDIRWTQSNRRNISVAHRASVARLDELVGPKR